MPPFGTLTRRLLLLATGLAVSGCDGSEKLATAMQSVNKTFAERMARVRASYAQELASAIRGRRPSFCEAVLRRSDGSPATAHERDTPVRVDYLDANGSRGMVDSKTRIAFDEFSFALNRTTVEVAPFGWDWLALTVEGDAQVAEATCRRWFMHWFDPDDKKAPGPDGLLGVVHFMDEPVIRGKELVLRLDLGSAPEAALEELLLLLADASALRVRLAA